MTCQVFDHLIKSENMKLTITQLKRIIKEELSKSVKANTVGDALTRAGFNATTSNLKKYLNVQLDNTFWSSYNNEYKFATHDDPSMDYISISKEEIAALKAAHGGSPLVTDALLDVSGPNVEMVSGRSSFMIALGDNPKEAVRLFNKAATWCTKVKGPIDYTAANSIEIVTEEEAGVTIEFVPNPQKMAASFKAAADFLMANSGEVIHIDID